MPKDTILVVDDEPLNLSLLARLLNPEHRVLVALSGDSALALLQTERPDLILLDVMMPQRDGYDVLAQLQASPATRDIPVIFVTALDAETDEERGLSLGAVDYIGKPVKPAVVLARVRTHLALKHARDRLQGRNAALELEVTRRMRESLIAQELTLSAMAELAETRDNETGNHIARTQHFVECLARQLQRDPAFSAQLDEAQVHRITKAAPMHDIGKIGIRDHILLKPGRLTAEEFEVMKTHARIGGDAIAHAIRKAVDQHVPEGGFDAGQVPESIRFLEVARAIATHHHERWDGQGYPDGLAGAAIPLAARLMAVADVYDALTTSRVYKAPWTCEAAAAHIVAQSGTHFDPAVVAAFVAQQAAFAEICALLRD
jgi:putative two-component system response regulator